MVHVVLYDNDGNGIFWGLPQGDIERAIRRTVDNWNENGLANVRLQYDGITTNPGSLAPWAYIIIRETSDCFKCGDYVIGCEDSTVYNNWVHHSDVYLVYNQEPGSECNAHKWTIYPAIANGDDDFQGVLMHEIGHSLGLLHPYEGGQPNNMGIMCTGNPMCQESRFTDQRYLSRDDVEGLVAKWGWHDGRLNYKESSDGGYSWSDGSTNNTAISAPSSINGCPNFDSSTWVSFLGTYQGNSPVVQYRSGNNGGWAQPAPVMASMYEHSWDAPAMAKGHGTNFVAFWALETPTNNNKYLRFGWTNNGGQSWTFGFGVRNDGSYIRSRRDNLSATYDPISDRFIVGYLADDNWSGTPRARCNVDVDPCDAPAILTVTRDGLFMRHTVLTDAKSIDAPGIACRNASGDNCVIAWGSVTGNACLHWGHGRVTSDGTFTRLNDLNQCYTMYQTPFVTVDTDPGYPFKIVFRQNNTSFFVMRKSGATNAYWDFLGGTSAATMPYGSSVGSYSWWNGSWYSSKLVTFFTKSSF